MRFTALFLVSTTLSTLAAPATTQNLTVDDVKKAFASAKIVPDVLPDFKPKGVMYLTYTGNLSDGSSSKVVLPGTNLVRNDTLIRPEFSVQGLGSGPYVIAIVDPDAPSRASPTLAQIRHMLAGNMTVTKTQSQFVAKSLVVENTTSAINNYQPPTPPAGSGQHRYVALLYAQPPEFDFSFLNVADIRKFNVSGFAARAKLGEPLAGTFLTVDGPPAR